jgi:hypothetical protein
LTVNKAFCGDDVSSRKKAKKSSKFKERAVMDDALNFVFIFSQEVSSSSHHTPISSQLKNVIHQLIGSQNWKTFRKYLAGA